MHARIILATLGITLAAMPVDAQTNNRGRSQSQANRMRFVEMDANNDGRITRAEWRGSAQSFRVHDWNRDNMLSGDEVRLGAQRGQTNPGDFTGDGEYQFDDWTTRGFTALDHNRDGRVARDEWHFDYESFRRADHNRDGVVSRAEFLNEGNDVWDDDRGDRFADFDANNDGRVARAEWHASRQAFDNLDDNRDGQLTRAEMRGNDAPPELFSSIDVNRDGTIRIDEWHWSQQSWEQRDSNRDGRLTREEFLGRQAVGTSGTIDSRSAAYKAGFDRGRNEGRQAGISDRHASWGWDLEGQRELQQADSGYDSRYGPRAEYQAGYRAGFRQAYPEGFRQGQ